MDNNRDKIEAGEQLPAVDARLAGLYYGDEIGMGDNIYLGDRNGVRTPMQWSPDRNGRLLARRSAARLSAADPWTRSTVTRPSTSRRSCARRGRCSTGPAPHRGAQEPTSAFGRGTFKLLDPGNRKVLAYLREYGDDESSSAWSTVALGATGRTRSGDFQGPRAGRTDRPQRFPAGRRTALPADPCRPRYYCFRLTTDAEVPYWHEERLARAELPVLVLTEGWLTFSGGKTTPPCAGGMAATTRASCSTRCWRPTCSATLVCGQGHAIERIKIVEQAPGNRAAAAGCWTWHRRALRRRSSRSATSCRWPSAWDDRRSEERACRAGRVDAGQGAPAGRTSACFTTPSATTASAAPWSRHRQNVTCPLAGGRLEFRANAAPSPISPPARRAQPRHAAPRWSRATPRCTSADQAVPQGLPAPATGINPESKSAAS
jgi:hypothetical protein